MNQNTQLHPPPPPPPPPHQGHATYSNYGYAHNSYSSQQQNYSYNPIQYQQQTQTPNQSPYIPSHPQTVQTQPFLSQKNWNQNRSETNMQNINTQPEQQIFHCKPCKINFQTQAALSAHTKSHITCNYPKCSFCGSRKVVAAHYSQQHGKFSGRGLKSIALEIPGTKKVQRFKICVGNHTDDIKAWIEERKKKFPTRQRVLEKEEKKKRKRGVQRGCGSLESIPRDAKLAKRDSDDTSKEFHTSKVDKEGNNEVSTLTGLMAGYSSSEDGNSDCDKTTVKEEQEKGTDLSKSNNNLDIAKDVKAVDDPHKHKTKHCHYFTRNGTCRNGGDCNYIHDIEKHNEFKLNQKKHSTNRKKQAERNLLTTGRPEKSQYRRTLLRSLLQNDIHRERSLTLQLLRYIVDCNYLQEQREEPNGCSSAATAVDLGVKGQCQK